MSVLLLILAAQATVAFEPAGPIIAGDPVRIVAEWSPAEAAILELERIDESGRTWRSSSEYAKPEAIDADVLGPFRTLRLRRDVERAAPPANGRAEELTASLRIDGAVVATSRLRRWLRAPGVELRPVDDTELVAELAVPGGEGPHPAVLVVGDANGGIRGQRRFAELLASHGYAALALAYFGAAGLPEELQDIPLEYCDRAIDWLVSQPAIDGERLAVLGGSKGGELSLLLASRDPRIRAVVAIAPSSVVFQGIPSRPPTSSWSEDGEPLPYVRYARESKFAKSGLLVDLYAASLDAASAEELAAATIPVERIRGAVLLLAGQRDNLWPASRMARAVQARLRGHDHPFEVTLLDFEDAGHEVGGPGYGPATTARSMGGTGPGKARALAEGWVRTLEFFARHYAKDK